MLTIYGIKNCDTVKKALKWLDENNVKYHFHDYKKEGADEKELQKLIKKFTWQKVLNLKSRTWRELSDDQKATDEISAINLAKQNPSIIKRPIIDDGSTQIIGFDVEEYEKFFG